MICELRNVMIQIFALFSCGLQPFPHIFGTNSTFSTHEVQVTKLSTAQSIELKFVIRHCEMRTFRLEEQFIQLVNLY